MSEGLDLRGVCLFTSRRQQPLPRLTTEAPVRVFHQVSAALNRCINDHL